MSGYSEILDKIGSSSGGSGGTQQAMQSQQQMGMQQGQQMLQQGLAGQFNPLFKDMSNQASLETLIKMLQGGQNGRRW